MQELLIATNNPGKFSEIMEIMSDLTFEFVFLKNLNLGDCGFVEDGGTFAENAYKKASFFAGRTGMMTLAEDSGILVDALEGELGVKTRRWGAGEDASDEEWIEYFMKKMDGVSDRAAKFVCSACVVGGGIEEYFEDETKGRVTEGLEAPILEGLPLSSCFVPEGYEKVYAVLGEHEKNEVSHRGKAMKAVRNFLEGLV